MISAPELATGGSEFKHRVPAGEQIVFQGNTLQKQLVNVGCVETFSLTGPE